MTQSHGKRILHCIPTLMVGGAERQIVLLSAALPAAGWETHIASVRGGPFEAQIDSAATLHRIGAAHSYDPRIAVRLYALIRRLRPSIVQTWLPMMDVTGGAAALASRVPWVIFEQASSLAYDNDWRLALRHRLGRWASGIVANSQGGLAWWHDRNDRHEFHEVIPNLVMLPPAAEMAVPRQAQRPRIVYVGRLSEEKRVATLISAMPIVRRHADIEAEICGDGPLSSELRAQAESLGLAGAVQFPGFVMDVHSRLRASDVFVSVSAFEGQPNTVQEAMVVGTPIVVSDIPAHREIADERCAMLVDGDDPQAVATAILATLASPLRAAARAAIARERVAEPFAGAAAWTAYYERLLAGSRRRPRAGTAPNQPA